MGMNPEGEIISCCAGGGVPHQRPRVGMRVFVRCCLILASALREFTFLFSSKKKSNKRKCRRQKSLHARSHRTAAPAILRDRLFWRIALLLSCAINNQVLGASDSVMESLRAMIRCSSFAEKAMADEGAGIMDEFILG